MAKVQGKKAASSARRTSQKAVSRVKAVARAAKKKVPARKPAAPSRPAKPARPSRPAKAAKAPARAAKVVKAVKAAGKSAGKAAKQVTKAVSKKAARVVKAVEVAKKPALVARAAAVIPAKAAPLKPAPAPAAPRAAEAKKGRVRRLRPRVHSNGAPVANWLPPGAEKPRPSSFIPAPPRAEAPSLIAAPPASSDRLVRIEDVTEFVTRTVPVRVDVEQGGGRLFISANPLEVTLRVGEGIEWDFRYIGGADITVDEMVVDFEKPAPFSTLSFRSRKPGTARPHRQLSGPAQKAAGGRQLQYTIRGMSPFKTEIVSVTLSMAVLP